MVKSRKLPFWGSEYFQAKGAKTELAIILKPEIWSPQHWRPNMGREIV